SLASRNTIAAQAVAVAELCARGCKSEKACLSRPCALPLLRALTTFGTTLHQPAIGAMSRFNDVTAAIGNTPLIRLNAVSEATGCEIWGKAEFLNPGQSVKDRAALYIIRDAVARGTLG